MECEVDIPINVASQYIWLHGNSNRLQVYTRYAWDGPSGPTFDTPTNMRASLFHDALCQLINDGLLDKKYRRYADELLRTHMLEDQALYADGALPVRMGNQPRNTKKIQGWKRAIYLRWGKFRANGYYNAVRGWSKLKGIYRLILRLWR